MDMTFDEYIDYLNHFFLMEFIDFEYKEGGSSVDALTIL